jgi:hypothetical protein
MCRRNWRRRSGFLGFFSVFFFPLLCAVLRVSVVLHNYFVRLFGYVVEWWTCGVEVIVGSFSFSKFSFFGNACSSDLFILNFAAKSCKVRSITV